MADFRRWLRSIVAMALLATGVGGTWALDGGDLRPIVMNNVVLISSSQRNGSPELGYGLIVGRAGDLVWIATARHVVVWPPTPAVDKIEFDRRTRVEFLWGGQADIALPPRGAIDPDLDVAFIAVRSPLATGSGLERWRTPVLRLAPARDEEVRVGGSNKRSIELADESGRVVVAGDGERDLALRGLSAYPGQSGAPLMSKFGVLGMLTSSGPSGASEVHAVPIARVQRAATLLLVPWQLSPNEIAGGPVVHVCLRHLGTEHPALVLGGTLRIAGDANGGCGEVNGGDVGVATPDVDVRCLPDKFMIRDAAASNLAVHCDPRVSGLWTDTSGGAQVEEVSEDAYSFSGLQYGTYGRITGRLTGWASSLIFDGHTVGGQRVIGTAKVSRTQLDLALTMPDGGRLTASLNRP
jgi:hypothetical protein